MLRAEPDERLRRENSRLQEIQRVEMGVCLKNNVWGTAKETEREDCFKHEIKECEEHRRIQKFGKNSQFLLPIFSSLISHPCYKIKSQLLNCTSGLTFNNILFSQVFTHCFSLICSPQLAIKNTFYFSVFQNYIAIGENY